MSDLPTVQIDAISQKLKAHDISFVATREIPNMPGQTVAYYSCKTVTNAAFLVELKFKQGMNVCKVTVKSPNRQMSELCKVTVAKLIAA